LVGYSFVRRVYARRTHKAEHCSASNSRQKTSFTDAGTLSADQAQT